MNVTKDNVESLGLEFKPYQKQGLTQMAGPFDPPVNIETVTGMHLVDDKRCYIALDADGYPYPVEEGIVESSYVLVTSDTPEPEDTAGHTVEVYMDEGGEFRWRRKAGNHEVIYVSGEGYSDKGYALDTAAKRNPGIEPIDLTEHEVEQTNPLP